MAHIASAIFKLRKNFLFFFVITSTTLFAQNITVNGNVSDGTTKQKLANATIRVGTITTKTTVDGNFSLVATRSDLVERGITISSIGYITTRLLYQPNHFYEVKLIENETQLNEVLIAPGDDIIKKAIAKIPENYPEKPIVVKGILRQLSWRNKSQYFKSDALIKAYIQPYSSNEKTTVAVLQNQLDTINDQSLRYIPKVGSYNIVDWGDFAHNKSLLNKILKKKKFDYRLVGKQVYNSRKVYVINILLKDTAKVYDKMEATFYIDTASYAFVAANITYNNIKKIGPFLPIKLSNLNAVYDKIENKWYLKEVHHKQTSIYKDEEPITTIDFSRTEIDNINKEKIAYKDIVQRMDDVLKIDKPGNKQDWVKSDSLFKQAESEGLISIVPNMLLDSIKKNNLVANQNYKRKFGQKLLDYMIGGNIRSNYWLGKLPVQIKSDDLLVSGIANYGTSVGANFRLYQNVFIGFQAYSNIRNNHRMGYDVFEFNLANEFVFNKSIRSITVTPSLGYQMISLKYQELKNRYDSFNFNLRLAKELSHSKDFFVSASLNTATETTNINAISFSPQRYGFGIGLLFK